MLAVSVLANAGIYFGCIPYEQEQISGLIVKTNMLSMKNMQLEQQLNVANLSLQGSSCSLDFYRSQLAQGGRERLHSRWQLPAPLP
ncbi:MAG: hypothetical protein LUO98_05800 [Methanoregula sp.]|nr:hypothetical protein [Methanoregula sp.]